PAAGVVIVDPFCEYLGKRATRMLEEAGYAVMQVLSPHLVQHIDDPEVSIYRAPSPGREVQWIAKLPFPPVAVLCESDAGLATAERLQSALLGRRYGGVNEARRDKFLMNEASRAAGLETVQQIKTGHWHEVVEFATALTRGKEGFADDTEAVRLVVKPLRGCASGDVYLCQGLQEAETAFHTILGTPKYGTPGVVNDEVLVQGYLQGTEYVVDTVSRDGEHK
ncbi:unnamed protein product, partial [Choristocarpus tenellus]